MGVARCLNALFRTPLRAIPATTAIAPTAPLGLFTLAFSGLPWFTWLARLASFTRLASFGIAFAFLD